MKKLIISALLTSHLFAADLLTGDTKLACEAILCLSSGDRPPECKESINKLFSITSSTAANTIAARRDFLNLCPTDADDDIEFTNLRDSVLVNLNDPCAAENLNTNISTQTTDHGTKQYQVSATVSETCEALINNEYTSIIPIYTCNQNIWYTQEDWDRGYMLIDDKKVAIKKDCWIVKK